MGLAIEQDVKVKPEEKSSWSFRQLFPVKAVASVLSKKITSLFDFILLYLVIVISITELIGHKVSWFMWIFTILIFLAVLSSKSRENETKHDNTKHNSK